MNTKIKLTVMALFSGITLVMAQETEEDLGTETVTVTKAYSPTVSDAFKLKSNPVLNDSITLQKKPIEYSIFSVPVASTFTPAKGKASKVTKLPPPVLYNSYASLGVGNYKNAAAEFYTSRPLSREERLDIGLHHLSSRGAIDGVALNNTFSDSKINGTYSKKERDLDWRAAAALQHQTYNWYGLPSSITDLSVISNIDERQQYYMAEAAAHIGVEDAVFKSANLQYRRFWDAVKSGENRVVFDAVSEFPLNDADVQINARVDYLNGSFKNDDLNSITNTGGSAYSNLQVGINPSFTMLRDDLSLRLGLNLVYGADTENSASNFYIYPAITASYRLLEETVIAYGGIVGELKQNSYYDFVEENPFVSPTLQIAPTDQQYKAYAGAKGQLLPNLSYNVKAFYAAENKSPLYKLNPINNFRTDAKGYFYGNSFELFYDDIKTLGFFAELNLDINRNFTLSANAEFFSYQTETGNSAWNLPTNKASLFLDYQIGEKWFMGANLFYIGERQDVSTTVVQNVFPSANEPRILNLEAYFDANAHVGYRYTKQWSFFLKGANLGNTNYQRWANYPVQGIQILGGATYKFDF